jgi:hypothetical protein
MLGLAMTESDIFDEFQKLWRSFSICCQAAETLDSPDPEDDQFIKMAIVGFSYHDKTENWEHGHFKLARQYDDESARLGDSDNLRKFNLLALGSILGLYSAGKIDERLYRLGYALLPGFVMSKGGEVDKL